MKLQEFHAKTLLLEQGLPVPDYTVVETPAEARAAAPPLLAPGGLF
jgi:succinyl-CoA synthetase beta subunit